MIDAGLRLAGGWTPAGNPRRHTRISHPCCPACSLLFFWRARIAQLVASGALPNDGLSAGADPERVVQDRQQEMTEEVWGAVMAGVARGLHSSNQVLAEALHEYPMMPDGARDYVAARVRGDISIPRGRPSEPPGRAWPRAIWLYHDTAVYQERFRNEGSRGPHTQALELVAPSLPTYGETV